MLNINRMRVFQWCCYEFFIRVVIRKDNFLYSNGVSSFLSFKKSHFSDMKMSRLRVLSHEPGVKLTPGRNLNTSPLCLVKFFSLFTSPRGEIFRPGANFAVS